MKPVEKNTPFYAFEWIVFVNVVGKSAHLWPASLSNRDFHSKFDQKIRKIAIFDPLISASYMISLIFP
jgi:hypothetical protein